MKHLGDFDTSAVIYGKFTTYRPSTGAAFALGGTPALSVYKDNSTTQSTTGVTLTADFDTVTGLNHFAIDTSADGTFYAAGSFFDIVITTGTVDSVSVVGAVVGSFTLRKTAALKPTTAGRTLDVTATGAAGIDWGNVENPTTALNLSGTNIDVDQVVASVSGAVGSVGAGGITATSLASDTITAAKVAADVSTEIRDKMLERTTLRGTVSTSSTTTSVTTSAMSPATSVADQVKGRIIIFDQDTTTAALRGQATDITASSASATPTLTVTALTNAPASGDTFTIV